MLKKIFMILIIIQVVLSQQTQEGTPFSQIYDNNNYDIILLPLVDNEKLLEDDMERDLGTPFRYGYNHEVSYSSKNIGTWEKTDNGEIIWRISFISEGAYSISFIYDDFHIPEGGELYVYSPGYDMIQGAYTHLNNSRSKEFSTPHLQGDEAIIEYYHPNGNKEDFSIQIKKIIHDYRDIMGFYNDERDWECGVNVICETEQVYQGPINSVAFLDMGGFICSGAMVNNVRQDLTPYFLTAWHCIDGSNPNIFRFYFNKMASSCGNTWGSSGEYAYSSDLLAHSDGIAGGDWALLRIDDDIEEEWEVYYAGWNATEDHPIISCGVHHPGGSPKKINYDDDTAWGAWWDDPNAGLTHWQVNWDEGGSEGGSSGSPIFNERYQIVGVLTGGSGGCGEGWPDLYGKLYLGWNWELDTDRRMIDYLDPDYSGILSIEGTYVEVTGMDGDLNSDDTVNILDIIALANLILNGDTSNELADLNDDGNLNILDIIALVNIILNN